MAVEVGLLYDLGMNDVTETAPKSTLSEEQEVLLSSLPHIRPYLELPPGDPKRELAIEIVRGVTTDLLTDNLIVQLGALESTLGIIEQPNIVVNQSKINYDPDRYIKSMTAQYRNVFAKIKSYSDKLSLGSGHQDIAQAKISRISDLKNLKAS